MKLITSLLFILSFLFLSNNSYSQTLDSLESFPSDHEFYRFFKLDGKEYSLSSPYHSFHTHIDFLDDDNYYPDISARAFNPRVGSLEERIKLATELKLIFRANNIYTYNTFISLRKNYVDKKTDRVRFTISQELPDIYLVKYADGNWYYSRFTSTRIPSLYEEFYPKLTRNFLLEITKFKENGYSILGIRLWKIILTIGIILAIALIRYLLNNLLYFIITKYYRNETKKQTEVFKDLIKRAIKTTTITLSLLLFYWCIPLLLLVGEFSYFLTISCKILIGFYSTIILYRASDIVVYQIYKKNRYNKMRLNKSLTPLLLTSLKIVSVIVGTLSTLHFIGFDINKLVAGISFGGILIALAAQDTVKNFFSSIMLFTDQPFKVGDFIEVDTQSGIVEEIGFRSTRIRTLEDSLLVLPNNQLSDNKVDNKGKRNYRRFNTVISITYDTPREKIIEFTDGIREIIKSHPLNREEIYYAYLNQFGPSSLDIIFQMYFATPDRIVELKSREEIMLAIIKLAEEIDVEFAFPTQTLYLNNEEGDNLNEDDKEKG